MAHTWKFFRAGGFDQVKLETGADLANLDQLDQKLWVALACPTRGLEFDSRTLDLVDADNNIADESVRTFLKAFVDNFVTFAGRFAAPAAPRAAA